MSDPHELRATSVDARFPQLDILRGFALFGVLIVNLGEFSGADAALEAGLPVATDWGAAVVTFLSDALLETKSAALLAMLFGAGLAIQSERATAIGVPHARFVLRRAGVLALIGIAHTFLLWNGDILFDYAVISLMVLPFLGLGRRRILWAIPALLLVSAVIAAILLPLVDPLATPEWLHAEGLRRYGSGSWWESLEFRTWETLHVMGPMRLANRLAILTPFFVLGVYFWKRGLFSRPEEHRRTLLVMLWLALGLGLVSSLVPRELLATWVNREIAFQPLRILIKATHFLAQPATTLGYLAAVLLLVRLPAWRIRLSVLAPLGRTTLSQYLLQSVVCTFVFNGFGLGLYGKVPIALTLLGGTALFALQVWTSRLWLDRFATGPAEWLWRRLVYPARRHEPTQPAPPLSDGTREIAPP